MAVEAWTWPGAADIAAAKRDGKRVNWPLWTARYEAYRLQGPGRSLLAVYNAERAIAHKLAARSVPSAWAQMAQPWKDRAAAWDLHQLSERRREQEAQERALREQARASRRRLLDVGYVILLEAMARVKDRADDQVAVRLMGAIQRYSESTRREYGDTPAGLSEALEALEHVHADQQGERLLHELAEVRRAAWAAGELRLVLDTLKTEQTLRGLAAPQRLEHSGPHGGPIETSGVVIYLPDNGRGDLDDSDGTDGNDDTTRT